MHEQQTILLVDDSESDIFLMRMAFEKVGFRIPLREVHNGAQAIAYLQGAAPYGDRNRFPLPTLMLLDLNMPRVNGFGVLAWARSQPGLKRLTIVVVSASMRIEDIERGFDVGANAFVVKPPTLDGLVEVVRALKGWMKINRFPSLIVQSSTPSTSPVGAR